MAAGFSAAKAKPENNATAPPLSLAYLGVDNRLPQQSQKIFFRNRTQGFGERDACQDNFIFLHGIINLGKKISKENSMMRCIHIFEIFSVSLNSIQFQFHQNILRHHKKAPSFSKQVALLTEPT